MTESSNTCDADGPADPRNCVGYSIRELYLGTTTEDGDFHDSLRHTRRSGADDYLLLFRRSLACCLGSWIHSPGPGGL